MSVRATRNSALSRSAELAGKAPISPVHASPAIRSFSQRAGFRTGVAAAVAGILYGSCSAAFAQAAPAADQAPATGSNNELQEVVVTATAQSVKKLDASYNIVTAS